MATLYNEAVSTVYVMKVDERNSGKIYLSLYCFCLLSVETYW